MLSTGRSSIFRSRRTRSSSRFNSRISAPSSLLGAPSAPSGLAEPAFQRRILDFLRSGHLGDMAYRCLHHSPTGLASNFSVNRRPGRPLLGLDMDTPLRSHARVSVRPGEPQPVSYYSQCRVPSSPGRQPWKSLVSTGKVRRALAAAASRGSGYNSGSPHGGWEAIV